MSGFIDTLQKYMVGDSQCQPCEAELERCQQAGHALQTLHADLWQRRQHEAQKPQRLRRNRRNLKSAMPLVSRPQTPVSQESSSYDPEAVKQRLQALGVRFGQ